MAKQNAHMSCHVGNDEPLGGEREGILLHFGVYKMILDK